MVAHRAAQLTDWFLRDSVGMAAAMKTAYKSQGKPDNDDDNSIRIPRSRLTDMQQSNLKSSDVPDTPICNPFKQRP